MLPCLGLVLGSWAVTPEETGLQNTFALEKGSEWREVRQLVGCSFLGPGSSGTLGSLVGDDLWVDLRNGRGSCGIKQSCFLPSRSPSWWRALC